VQVEPALVEVLADARRLGFLGPAPIADVIAHARLFVAALAGLPPASTVLDLGTGGGVPGLVIAHDRPDLSVVLLDRRTRRTDAVERFVRRLGWTDRVTVRAADATHVTEPVDAVVARGFGPPEATVSTAARWCVPGGIVVISDPPGADRWQRSWLEVAGVDRVENPPPGMAVFRRRATPTRR
jgi:16S rRNA (guanine527-N7)-methyltransferase